MKPKPTALTDQLRHFIEAGEMSRYELSKITGIDKAVLSKFVHGKCGLSMQSLDKIGEILNLQITKRPTTAKRRKGG
jgi:transcriptional regulator with XRE-family HTH domain